MPTQTRENERIDLKQVVKWKCNRSSDDDPIQPLRRYLSRYGRGNTRENLLSLRSNGYITLRCRESVNEHCRQGVTGESGDDHEPPEVLESSVFCVGVKW